MEKLSGRKSDAAILMGQVAESATASKVAVSLSPDASPLERYAVAELKRLAVKVFDRPRGSQSAAEQARQTPAFLVGLPATNPQVADLLAEGGQAPLGEQEYLILPCRTEGRDAVLLTGGSPAAVLWAVYDLAESWGVTFLTDQDVMPAHRPTQAAPAQPVRRSPALSMRAWRGFNQLPHSGAYWGLKDYVGLIDQLAKMRFNAFIIADGPNTPLVDYTWADVRKQTAELSFGWRYPIGHHTIGREKFNGETCYENPDIPADGSYHEKVVAARRLITGVLDHARSRGMQTGISIRFTEFSEEFKQRLIELSERAGFTAPCESQPGYTYRLGVAREGADPDGHPYMTVRNPHYVDLIHTQLDAYFEQCAGCDRFILWPPEFNNANADVDFAWRSLCKHYDLGDIAQLHALAQQILRDAGEGGNTLSKDRVMQQVYSHVCNLYLMDELLNRRGLKRKYELRADQITACLPTPALGALSSRVLGEDASFLVGLGNGYHASSAARHVQQLDESTELTGSLYLTLSLEDDNIGLTPQFTGPSLDTLLKKTRRFGIDGFWCRQWLLNKIEPTIHYLSHVAWNPDLTPDQTYPALLDNLCGEAATPVMLEALALGERITLENDEAMNLHSFLVPRMLAKYWEDGAEVKPEMRAMRPKYRQLTELLERAAALSHPRGRFFIDRLIGQSRFAEQWIITMEKVHEAAQAHEEAQQAKAKLLLARMDECLRRSVALLDEALQAVEAALKSWAGTVGDRADLGALAALNEYGHRYLLAIRHVQFLRTEQWECQLNPPND